MTDNNCKITIVKNGPYIVSGNVPLEEKIITHGENGNIYVDSKRYPDMENYALCRCGKSSKMPFCDGSHVAADFKGNEKASRKPYKTRAEIFKGPVLTLEDDESLCAFARFCNTKQGDVWELTEKSDNKQAKEIAIKAACNCPSGRLVIRDNSSGLAIEPEFEPSIVILQDSVNGCSGPIWVRGNIPIESSDGTVYEIRNRVTLCRCGKSRNTPFCDARHVDINFSDVLN
ncbi:MAG: CDGSH iron-sulfur domain-containing protein [Saccharofermentanales bacterium]